MRIRLIWCAWVPQWRSLGHVGHAVLGTATSTLLQRLLAARRDLRLPQELTKLDRFVCVFLDDIGYV